MKIEDVLTHPTNAEGWKHIDFKFPDFASVSRNVCLILTLDGFNIFGHMYFVQFVAYGVNSVQFSTLDMHERVKLFHVTSHSQSKFSW